MSQSDERVSPLRDRSPEDINDDLIRPVLETSGGWWILTVLTGLGGAWALGAFIYQLNVGMGTTGLNNPVNWGFYIINFVFWVGISHSGTMISAILRLTKAEWRYPITRAAEAMTLFSLMMAGLFPLIHLGRNWLFWYMIPLPWGRGLWPNFRSPLLWDMTAIFTYMTGSSLFLYLALIPDLGLYRDHEKVTGWRKTLYKVLSLGWRGTHFQWRWFERASIIMTVVIIPVFASVHTIVSWDFGMTIVPGWHSTIFAPYFVVGAILSGVAAVITLMVLLRWSYGLEDYITREHFDQLGKMLLGVSLLWTYFFVTETGTVWFSSEAVEKPQLIARTIGQFWPLFVIMVVTNTVIPVLCFSIKRFRRWIPGMLVVSLLINVGMFIERFLIIVPSLAHTATPFSWGNYAPSWVELSITVGALCGFTFLYLLFIKLFPLIPVWEIKEGEHSRQYRTVGDREIPETLAPIEERGFPPPKFGRREP
ncbi:MAG: NrfD/PsrC family molybdoenzyme membrane anchor subunit [bacterium]